MDLKSRKLLWLKISSFIMVITLLWLTVSMPFVYQVQQNLLSFSIENNAGIEETDSSNPLMPNPTEEKTEKGSNNFSEYLDHLDLLDQISSSSTKHILALSADLYLSYHGELLTPPPNSMV
jgi:hypothetical protein